MSKHYLWLVFFILVSGAVSNGKVPLKDSVGVARARSAGSDARV